MNKNIEISNRRKEVEDIILNGFRVYGRASHKFIGSFEWLDENHLILHGDLLIQGIYNLEIPELFRVNGGISIRYGSLKVNNLIFAESINVYNSTIEANLLENISSAGFSASDDSVVSVPSLKTIEGDVYLNTTREISMPNLELINGDLNISGPCDLPKLYKISKRLNVTYISVLPQLTEVGLDLNTTSKLNTPSLVKASAIHLGYYDKTYLDAPELKIVESSTSQIDKNKINAL